MIKVKLDRLVDMANIDDKCFQWNEDDVPISIDEIIKHMKEGISGNPEPYGDTWKYIITTRDRMYHIARIIYFIEHPGEISGIEVDNKCNYWSSGSAILPACIIIDGWHRLAAAMALGLEYIEIYYGGRCDIEDYLACKTDYRPNEIF